MELVTFPEFMKRTLGGHEVVADMNVYWGHPFDCACGESHIFGPETIDVIRQLPLLEFVFQCPEGAITYVGARGLPRFKGFESLFGVSPDAAQPSAEELAEVSRAQIDHHLRPRGGDFIFWGLWIAGAIVVVLFGRGLTARGGLVSALGWLMTVAGFLVAMAASVGLFNLWRNMKREIRGARMKRDDPEGFARLVARMERAELALDDEVETPDPPDGDSNDG